MLHHGRILLRSLIDGINGIVDFAQANRLLSRRLDDRCHMPTDFLDLGGNTVERGTGLIDELKSAARRP